MAASRCVCLICRPLRGLGVCVSKKRDCIISTRNFCFFVVIVILVAAGLTYTTIYDRTKLQVGDFQQHAYNEIAKILELSGKKVTIQTTVTHVTGSSGREKTKDKMIKNSFEMIFDVSNRGQIDGRDIKDSEIELNFIRSNRNNSPISSKIASKADENAEVLSKAKDSSSIVINQQRVSIQKKSKDDVTVDGSKSTNATDKFECPESFRISDPDTSWFRSSIVQKSGKYLVPSDAVDEVLILTPVSNAKRHLKKYFQNVCSISYPHRHISIVLGEDSSSDETLETAEGLAVEIRPYFRRVQVLKLKGSSSRNSGHERHEMSYQLTRRRHLAMARNQLLFGALRDERWVLWLDSDVRHLPADVLERLLWPGKAIVAANCLYRTDDGQTDTFDRNTWRDTEASKRHLSRMSEDFLMLEGYEPTQRKTLNDLKEEGDAVRLDGVGGCALLVDGDLHRKGLVFPAFVFDHHVETEGLAKMAARMGIELFGLPSVNVIHW